MLPSASLRRNLTTSIFGALGVVSIAGACREATSVSSDGGDDGSGAADGSGSSDVSSSTIFGCCSGRPFLVGGRARTAVVRRSGSRSGWSGVERPLVQDLDDSSLAALAAAWLRDALLEHASVASFSRFALELMAVGAPSDLVDAAHEAARDEVRHARSCFAIASAYAGRELAPGPFEFGGSVEVASTLAAVAASAVKEGCVGETLAAVQAAVQLDGAEDPTLRKALEEISRDEARHAELAWRFVAWAVRTGGAPVIRAVETALEEALSSATAFALPPDVDAAVLVAHGRALPDVLVLAFAETITETIRPAMRILIASRSSAAAEGNDQGAAERHLEFDLS